jgi:Vitamin K epoxide reductase family/SPW repeat
MSTKKMRLALLVVALGLWLIALPLTFDYKTQNVGISDILCGILLALFALLSLSPTRVWAGWVIGLIGLWLQMAPLVFWASESLMYINDSLIGAIAIVLCFEMAKKEGDQPTEIAIPNGWSYNPSAWYHRIPTVCLALLCWFFSRYMAAYQLGYIPQVWDPFFEGGTLHVITSKISKGFPVSDAGMGAICYTLESVLGWQGSSRRWLNMPWLVFVFGFLVIPVGIVSITLIILQPVVVGYWCSWCLATAVCMLLMIVLTAGELAAVLQLLKESASKKKSAWKVFWKGAEVAYTSKPANLRSSAGDAIAWGFTFPWNLLISATLGIWLMASPSVLGIMGTVATSNFILGPMIAAISIIALAEVFRSIRYLNILFGLGLFIAPWLAIESNSAGLSNNLIVGILVTAFAFRKGKIIQKYGRWQKLIK